MLTDAALQKKRQFALERAERLKDPKQRVLGTDKHALDEQVKEKTMQKQLEKDRNGFFDNQAMLMDKHAQVLQREADEIRLQREREVREYREKFQKKEFSREWDLNDPKRIVGGVPARIADDDARCGAASMQKFEGEDLDSKNRKLAQAKQLRDWAQQQMDEKLVKKWMEKDANRQYEDRSEEMAFRTWQIEQEVANQRRQMAVTSAEFNKTLAEQKRKEKLMAKMNETHRNMEEIDNMLNSDVLNEAEPVMTIGARTTKSDRWKGLTNNEKSDITRTQLMQREQLEQKRRQEAEEERQLAQQEALENRMGKALDRQREREKREAAVQLGKERLKQSQEFQERKKALNEQYRNKIGEEYFVWGKCLD